tara:strand:- start:275 stop:847 length:573 start_codon:yes stop_codon:yes gene_type:complete
MFVYIFLIIFRFALADPMPDMVSNKAQPSMDDGVGEPPVLEPPSKLEVEERTYDLSKKLRCPVCQGLSVADSRSDAAVAMKMRIQDLVEQGYSDDQIVNYFIGRYGEWALLKPKYEHRFVWIAPIVASIVGLGFVGWKINRSRQIIASTTRIKEPSTEAEKKDSSVESSNGESNEQRKSYREQLLRELED